MTTNFDLKADLRKNLGSSDSRRIRKSGQIPATISAKGGESIHIIVGSKDLEHEYYKGNLFTTVVNIDLDGKKIKAITRKIDLNPVTDRPAHIDFVKFEKDEKVKSKVKVEFTNKEKSPGIKKGGFLHIVLRKVELICDPNSIPTTIQVDIGALSVGSKIRSMDLKLPDGVTLAKNKNFIIASIIGRGSKADEEEAKAAAPAEGAAAAPKAGAAKDAGDKKEGDKKEAKKPEAKKK